MTLVKVPPGVLVPALRDAIAHERLHPASTALVLDAIEDAYPLLPVVIRGALRTMLNEHIDSLRVSFEDDYFKRRAAPYERTIEVCDAYRLDDEQEVEHGSE